MNNRTLHLRGSDTISKTFELRFVDRAGRYILQQLSRIKNGRVRVADSWDDVPLVKEAGK